MKRKLLVVYASRYGQTEKIARRIGDVAQQRGIESEVLETGFAAEAALAEATDVVVAGGIYFGRHDRALSLFVERMLPILGERHTAFVTVCGAANDAEVSSAYARKFLAKTAWKPGVTAVFAGATSFTRYGWLLRLMMRQIARSHGAGTDTSRDYEYTDWDAVDAFARGFVAEAQPRVA